MSALFNQTNLAPGTPFSGGSTSNGNFNNCVVSTLTVVSGGLTKVLENYPVGSASPGGLCSGNPNAFDTFTGSRLYFMNSVSPGQYTQNYIDQTGIFYQGQTTGTSRQFLNYNGNGGVGDETFAIRNLSSINHQTIPGTLSIGALISTLATAYPGCIS